MALTARRQAFCDAYLANGMNAAQAAREAGYSERSARSTGNRLLGCAEIQDYIKGRAEALAKERIASGDEVLAYLSDVMLGRDADEKVVTTESGVQTVCYVNQGNRVRAAEALAKCHGLTTQRIEHDGGLSVTFVDDLGAEPDG